MSRRLSERPRRLPGGSAAAGLALLLALAPQFGCGREFFRQWADQDVTEAIFEKSRDPRWRLEEFSIEPPALSRFADPFDVDRPPAPPDDRATEALSPTPQFAPFRLLTPYEGTGYNDMLDKGPRYTFTPTVKKPGEPGFIPPETMEPPAPLPAGPGPFTPPGNSGPAGGRTSPSSVPGRTPSTPPPSVPPSLNPAAGANPPQARVTIPRATPRPAQDKAVQLVRFQDVPANNPPAPAPAGVQPPQDRPAQERLPVPRDPLDPDQRIDDTQQVAPLPVGNFPGGSRGVQAETASFAAILTPGALDFDEAAAVGLPTDSHPYIIDPIQAMQLALINSRIYQSRLENIYTASLSTTLNRFAYEPQFYAGIPAVTGVATGPGGIVGASGGGFPAVGNSATSFLYRTKEAIGGQNATLSLNETAGVGKLFMFGGRLVGGFANQTIINFASSTPRQPAVTSFLPLTFVQPFLRGGGRTVTLEPLTQAERSLVYEVRSFARFRQQFMPYVMTQGQPVDASSNAGVGGGGIGGGGTTGGGAGTVGGAGGGVIGVSGISTGGGGTGNLLSGGSASDPSIGYLNVISDAQTVYNDRVTIAAYERLLRLYVEYAKSASSGISQIQVDQVTQNLETTRNALVFDELTYRNTLDQFKQQLGLPPDLPAMLDPTPIMPFRRTFQNIEMWAGDPKHDPVQLIPIIDKLPRVDPVIVDGRELLRYDTDASGNTILKEVYADPQKLEEYLVAAERIALENRLDLMNARAQLYDSWRQIAVTANALKGVFNITITNQYSTPGNTTNPFAFIDQSKQFSMLLNAELPLVRLSERNTFRSSLIAYRQRARLLMSQEDQVKYQVRSDVRSLIQFAVQYEIQRRLLFVTLRQRDFSLQQIIAPPTQQDVQAAGSGNSASQAAQTTNLIGAISSTLSRENQILANWVSFVTGRMSLYRDLGIMPFDEWEAYYEFFPPTPTIEPLRTISNPVGGGPAAGGAANPAPGVRP